jgi:hypothetical protein
MDARHLEFGSFVAEGQDAMIPAHGDFVAGPLGPGARPAAGRRGAVHPWT